MPSKPTQKRLALYLATMVILHAMVLWQEWSLIPIGFPDFSIFYTAARILQMGRASDLYDDHLQEAIQGAFAPAVEKRGSILPFNHPPFEAVFFRPFAALSFLTAYLLWAAIDVGMLMCVCLVLRRHLPRLSAFPIWLWLLAAIGFFPNFVALVQGQDSIFVLLCYGLAFAALQRKSEFSGGSWLGLGLCKFHLILPFLVAPLVQKRLKLIAGVAVIGAALTLLGLSAVGRHGLAGYPGYLWYTEHASQYRWNFIHGNNPNIRALLLNILPPGSPSFDIAIVVFSIALVGTTAYMWRLAWSGNSSAAQLAFALNLVGTLLVSYHTWVQDLSLLFLALLCAADVLMASPSLQGWQKSMLWACIAVLSFSPFYMVLLLRFGQMQFIAVILLLFFAGLASAIRSLAATPRPAWADR